MSLYVAVLLRRHLCSHSDVRLDERRATTDRQAQSPHAAKKNTLQKKKKKCNSIKTFLPWLSSLVYFDLGDCCSVASDICFTPT